MRRAALPNRRAAGPGRGSGAVPVVDAIARKGNIGVYYTGLGAVTPIYTVTIKSQISGYLMQVLYKEGQMVHKGDLLAEIDPRPYQVMLEQGPGGIGQGPSQPGERQGRFEALPNARPPESRSRTATGDARGVGEVRRGSGRRRIRRKLIPPNSISFTAISPPRSRAAWAFGWSIREIMLLRPTLPGWWSLPKSSPSRVIFTLPEDQLPPILARMHAGARLKVEAYDREMKTKIAQGWLETMDNQIDPTTGTVKLRANFDNRDGSLFPNQFVNARLLVEEKQGVTLIPTAAVQRNSQATYVLAGQT